jgi:hypothetical protein
MINEIDYVDDELNVNERYLDEKIIDHHNNRFVNDENNPIYKNEILNNYNQKNKICKNK